jgi:acyl homoserine lactone synthase
MIHYIEPYQKNTSLELLQGYFRLRKQVFCDQLRWVKPTPDGIEIDKYDAMYNVYIVNTDDRSGQVTGGVRLMPTTGPILLREAWPHMLPHPDDFRAPNIWEATRFCVAQESNSTRKGNFVNRATLALSLAVMDFGAANGITQVIGVCERKFFEMSGAYGAHAEVISAETDANGIEICCGIWSTAKEQNTLAWARAFLGAAEPLVLARAA